MCCEHTSIPSFEMPLTRQAKGQPNHMGNSGGDEEGTSNALPRTGISIGATSTSADQGSSNGGENAATSFAIPLAKSCHENASAKSSKKAPKCEYCKAKQKKGGEIFYQQLELVKRCLAYANLDIDAFYCDSCTQYLHQRYFTRRS